MMMISDNEDIDDNDYDKNHRDDHDDSNDNDGGDNVSVFSVTVCFSSRILHGHDCRSLRHGMMM